MSWLKVILLVFTGFNLNGAYGQRDRQRGALVGRLNTLQYNVSGTVWAVDEDKLYIEDFYYNGRGPDAFFWIGNTTQPSPRGHLIRYPLESTDGKEEVLGRMDGVNLLLHLPPGLKVTDMKWLSVWCRRFTVDFGHVLFPASLDPPRKRTLPEFQRLAHGLRSGNITILDAKTFYIPNLHYDGLGPDAYFWVGRGSKPDVQGHKIPNEMGSLDILRAYEGEDIELQLPDNMTVYDIEYLGVWCVQFKHNFGHVLIPRPEDLWVPPALGQTRIKLDELLEAYGVEADDRNAYQTFPVGPSQPETARPQQPSTRPPQPPTRPPVVRPEEEEEEAQAEPTDSHGSPTDSDSGSDPQGSDSVGQGSVGGGGAPSLPAPPAYLLLLLFPLVMLSDAMVVGTTLRL